MVLSLNTSNSAQLSKTCRSWDCQTSFSYHHPIIKKSRYLYLCINIPLINSHTYTTSSHLCKMKIDSDIKDKHYKSMLVLKLLFKKLHLLGVLSTPWSSPLQGKVPGWSEHFLSPLCGQSPTGLWMRTSSGNVQLDHLCLLHPQYHLQSGN